MASNFYEITNKEIITNNERGKKMVENTAQIPKPFSSLCTMPWSYQTKESSDFNKKNEKGKMSVESSIEKPFSEFREMCFLDEVAKLEEDLRARNMWPVEWPEKMGDYIWNFEAEDKINEGEIWYPYFDPEVLKFRVYGENIQVDSKYKFWDFQEYTQLPNGNVAAAEEYKDGQIPGAL